MALESINAAISIFCAQERTILRRVNESGNNPKNPCLEIRASSRKIEDFINEKTLTRPKILVKTLIQPKLLELGEQK